MGYACPVCGDPQSDAGHLANHLAFTAMLRGGGHEEWLAEHVPEWEGMDEAELAERVAEDAEETEFPQVFEDTTDQHDHESEGHDHGGGHGQSGHGHDQAHAGGHADAGDLPTGADALGDPGLDEAAREALAEAREMTRKRREDAREADGADGDTDGDETDGDGDDSRAGTETE